MNERVKQLRQSLNMTQEEFAQCLGVKRNTIGNYETGNRVPTNQIITSICREWNVNDEWLRTGKGSMFVELSQAERAAKAVASKLKTNNQFILNTFIALGELSEDEWTVIENFINKLVDKNEQKNKE